MFIFLFILLFCCHVTTTLFRNGKTADIQTFLTVSVNSSYSRHRGLLSSRRHTRTSRRLSHRHCSGHFYSRSLQRERGGEDGGADLSVQVRCVAAGAATLIAVDSVLPALAGLTGRPIETFVTLTQSGPLRPVHTESVSEAGLTSRSGTRLAVLPEEAFAAPGHLKTGLNRLLSFSLSRVWFLTVKVTYDVGLQAGGTAADGQQTLFLKHPGEHTFLPLH